MFRVTRPIRYVGRLPPLRVRRSGRGAAAAPAQTPPPFEEVRGRSAAAAPAQTHSGFEEVRGVHVTTYPDRIVVSNGIYSTYRYRDRLKAAGATWDGEAWTLPAGTDVRAVLAPPMKPRDAVRASWVCCADATILSHKNKHYSCAKHTMYWEECMGADGQPIKILYACSTRGGGCYTGN